MSRSSKFSTTVVTAAATQLKTATTIQQFREAQAILLPAQFGLTRAQTAEAVGLSESRIGAIQAQARTPSLKPKQSRGGKRRCRMTFEEEKEFLAPWAEDAKSAGMIIVPPMHAALEKHLGSKIHHSQVYRMLARHGWRKLAPDSVHPKTDPAKQEEFKKKSRTWWPKP